MVHYGVDYYPEHWPEERWEEDARLMQEAGFNVVRLAEFAWSRIEPAEGQYSFDWLDDAIDTLARHGIKVVLGTPTASPPPWLMAAHPELFIVWSNGTRATYGSRRLNCPTNPLFRDYTARIVRAMARHYRDNPHVIGWQIDNEFGERCYCPICQRAFQAWLQHRYGTLDELNGCWGTVFWSHEYTDWGQIPLPMSTSQAPAASGSGIVANPGLALDFARFMSDTYVEFQQNQVAILRDVCPHHFVTHNFMGFTYDRLNYFDLAGSLDLVAWDNYPGGFWKTQAPDPTEVALGHDTMRGLKMRSFWVMEQQAGPTGWGIVGPSPRPGELRLWAYQALAHGAEGLVYFRWRTARVGTEQYWHGILDHDGRPRRRYAEVRRVGQELGRIRSQLQQTEVRAPAAMLLSYDSRFAFEIQPNNLGFSYTRHFTDYYAALRGHGVDVDIAAPDANLSPYKLVIAPALHVLDQSIAEHLQTYVADGGVLILTARSGVKDHTNKVVDLPLPGWLAPLCGVEVVEYDSLPQGSRIPLDWQDHRWQTDGVGTEASVWCDVLAPRGAAIIARYAGSYFAGEAAATVHAVGKGQVIYVGTIGDAALATAVITGALELAKISPALRAPHGVEVTTCWRGQQPVLFILNHTANDETIRLDCAYTDLISGLSKDGTVVIPARDVLVLVN